MTNDTIQKIKYLFSIFMYDVSNCGNKLNYKEQVLKHYNCFFLFEEKNVFFEFFKKLFVLKVI